MKRWSVTAYLLFFSIACLSAPVRLARADEPAPKPATGGETDDSAPKDEFAEARLKYVLPKD